MADKKRSRIMASAWTSGTKPELLARKVPLAEGWRHRLGENYRKVRQEAFWQTGTRLLGRQAAIWVTGATRVMLAEGETP